MKKNKQSFFKKYILIITVVVAILICTSTGFTAFAVNIPDGYILHNGDILLDETANLEITAGRTTLIEFTPSNSGTYQFEAVTDIETDTFGYIFDSEFNQLAQDDDSSEYGYNFLVSYELLAGETYYLGAKFVDVNENGSIPVRITSVENDCNDILSFEYSVNNGEATITRYTGSATDVEIPSTINGYTVTSIGEDAFSYCKVYKA